MNKFSDFEELHEPPGAWVARHGLPVGAALFDAGGPTADPGRFAALALHPVETLAWRAGDAGDPLAALEALAARRPPDWTGPEGPQPHVACLLGYDLGRVVERVPVIARAEHHLPDLWAARYDAAWVYDRAARRGHCVGAPAGRARLAAALRNPPRPAAPARAGAAVCETDFAAYAAAFARVKAHILDGDVYQVNLTVRFRAPLTPGDPGPLFAALHARSPVPFAAALRPAADRAVLSISPERFLRWDAAGHVETRPIKGTRPRGATPEADAALAAALAASAKDRAEHVMIVDLERNDLGRVCRIGSVHVPRLCAPEPYATVHHLVSTVAGRLRPDAGLADLLRATFPGGSITGAPKLRAMEIIEALEPTRRGPYCGAVGYLDARGGGDLNLAIRTAWVAGDALYYQAGGGVVADSEARAEWDEAWVKARAFLDALG